MVARPVPTYSDSPTRRSGAAVRLFTTWRVVLTRLGRAIVRTTEKTTRKLQTTAAGTADLAGRASSRTVNTSRGNLATVRESLLWLFGGWRRAVSRMLSALRPRQRAVAAVGLLGDVAGVVRRPARFGELGIPAADQVAAFGLRAFLLGTTGAVILGWATAGSPWSALAAAVSSMLWAGARLVILLALAPRDRGARAVTAAAWSVSLLPYLLGVTEELRIVALGASALLCLGALKGAGLRSADARTMVGWAFGGQAGVLTFGWLISGGLAILTAL